MYKRLRKEAADAQRSTEPDLVLAPQQDNLQSWRAWVAGPTDTPFEGGVFELECPITKSRVTVREACRAAFANLELQMNLESPV